MFKHTCTHTHAHTLTHTQTGHSKEYLSHALPLWWRVSLLLLHLKIVLSGQEEGSEHLGRWVEREGRERKQERERERKEGVREKRGDEVKGEGNEGWGRGYLQQNC